MKTVSLFSMCFLAATMTAQVQLIDFEDGQQVNDKVTLENPVPSVEFISNIGVVANPDKTGVNKSEKAFNFTGESLDSKVKHVETRLFMTPKAPITVNADTRYMHIFVRRNFVHDNKAVVLMFNLESSIAPNSGSHLSRVERFEITPSCENVWQDMVIDLQGLIDVKGGVINTIAIVPNINRWTNSKYQLTELYIDDIVFNNDATPRGTDKALATSGTLLDFEDIDYTMNNIMGAYMANSPGNIDAPLNTGFCVDNPMKTGINATSKCLSIEKGLQMQFNGNVTNITPDTRYLHVMVCSPYDEATVTVACHNVTKPKKDHPTFVVNQKDTWVDLVVDLTTIMTESLVVDYIAGNEPANVQIPYLAGVGVSISPTTPPADGILPLTYVDEIAVSADVNTRSSASGIDGVVAAGDFQVYATQNGLLRVVGADLAEMVNVFTVSGQCVEKATVADHISLDRGMYIVKVGAKTSKVVVQ